MKALELQRWWVLASDISGEATEMRRRAARRDDGENSRAFVSCFLQKFSYAHLRKLKYPFGRKTLRSGRNFVVFGAAFRPFPCSYCIPLSWDALPLYQLPHPSSSSSRKSILDTAATMPDDIEKAIAVAKKGKMNPETFKKTMPESAARLRGNFDRSVSNALFDRIYSITESQLKYPALVEKELAFCKSLDEEANVDMDSMNLKGILHFVSLLTGMDTAVYDSPPFSIAYIKNVEQKCDIFPIDGDTIRDIYYSAYVKTAYEFQEEIETISQKRLTEVCRYMSDREEFVKEFMAAFRRIVTLPSEVETVEELIEHANEYHSARAVTNSFVKSVRVIKEIPSYYDCLQCWVCGKDDTQNCSSCKVAAFCCRGCQKKAWKKNHKVHCLHYERVMNFAEIQCKRIEKAFKDSFIAPGSSLLQPNQFFDYTMVISMVAMIAHNPGASLHEDTVSMKNFYRNVLQVEKDDKAFSNLFEPGVEAQSNPKDASLVNVCVGLMYNGNPPLTLEAPKVTRSTFLNAYKDVTGYVKQSEEMVKASVIEDLMAYYKSEDYSQFSDDLIKFMCQEIKDMEIK